MLLELKLVSRFLFSRRRSLVKFTSAVAVIGLAAGIAGLIVAQALARGFQGEMEDKLLSNAPHVAVFREDGGDLGNWRLLLEEIKLIENVETVEGSAAESVFLVGPSISNQAVMRTFDVPDGYGGGIPRIYVGGELAVRTGLVAGAAVDIVVLRNGSEARRTEAVVAGVFSTGLFDHDSTSVRVSAADFARIYGDDVFTPRSLNISVNDVYRSDETALAIHEKAGNGIRVVDWQEANRPLFAALSLEKKVAFFIILLIILIAILNITTTLALLVNERRFDIAVLRTCGAKTRSLVIMFVLEGAVLGAAGIVLGAAVGLLVCWAANETRLISLPADVYTIAYVPLRPEFADVLAFAAGSFLLCLIATFYPALAASRIKPTENFRIQ